MLVTDVGMPLDLNLGNEEHGAKMTAPDSNALSLGKKLLGANGIATRSKHATRGSWHGY